jgi:hypothetical protein
MRPLLVGEANPYGADPYYALYCEPANSAGGRLQRLILRISEREYIKHFDRVNLCPQKWNMKVARENAERISVERGDEAPIILFGAKVASAFGFAKHEPFTFQRRAHPVWHVENVIVQLPHPSGLCRVWHEPGAFERARNTIINAGILSADGSLPGVQVVDSSLVKNRFLDGSAPDECRCGGDQNFPCLACEHKRMAGRCSCDHAPCVHDRAGAAT